MKSLVRLTDHSDMTIDVYRGHMNTREHTIRMSDDPTQQKLLILPAGM